MQKPNTIIVTLKKAFSLITCINYVTHAYVRVRTYVRVSVDHETNKNIAKSLSSYFSIIAIHITIVRFNQSLIRSECTHFSERARPIPTYICSAVSTQIEKKKFPQWHKMWKAFSSGWKDWAAEKCFEIFFRFFAPFYFFLFPRFFCDKERERERGRAGQL